MSNGAAHPSNCLRKTEDQSSTGTKRLKRDLPALPLWVSVLHFIIHVVWCSFVRKQSTIQLTLHMILKSWSIKRKKKRIFAAFICGVALTISFGIHSSKSFYRTLVFVSGTVSEYHINW